MEINRSTSGSPIDALALCCCSRSAVGECLAGMSQALGGWTCDVCKKNEVWLRLQTEVGLYYVPLIFGQRWVSAVGCCFVMFGWKAHLKTIENGSAASFKVSPSPCPCCCRASCLRTTSNCIVLSYIILYNYWITSLDAYRYRNVFNYKM